MVPPTWLALRQLLVLRVQAYLERKLGDEHLAYSAASGAGSERVRVAGDARGGQASSVSDDDFVPLTQLNDPIRAEMLRDFLESEGVTTSVSGLNHRFLLGMVGTFVEISLFVRASDRDRAIELLEAFEHGVLVEDDRVEDDRVDDDDVDAATAPTDEDTDDEDDEEDEDGEEDEDDEPDEERSPAMDRRGGPAADPDATPRRKVIAAGAAFLFPGGAHFYARSNRGFAIVAAYAVAITAALVLVEGQLALLVPIVVADIAGGLEAVDRFNRGEASSALGARLSRGFAWSAWAWALAPAAVVYSLQTYAPEVYVGESGRALCALEAQCLEPAVADCESHLVEVVGALGRDPLESCAACVEGASCDAVWRFEVCDPEPMDGLGSISALFGDSPPTCEPGVVLRPRCGASCAAVLYEDDVY